MSAAFISGSVKQGQGSNGSLKKPHGDVTLFDTVLFRDKAIAAPTLCQFNAGWFCFERGEHHAHIWPVVMTEGHLLEGRIRYRQPATGFRSGLEPVLLAASIAAKCGERVLEAGTGAGAALLCLSARISGVHAVGVEIDKSLAELAAANAAANGFAQIEIQAGQFENMTLSGWFDHAMANPPYHIASGSSSPVPGRDAAKRGSAALIDAWIERLGAALRRRGSLTLSVPAGIVPMCLSAMARHHCPCTAIFPFWPRADRSAKLVLLRGMKLARSPMRLMPGLVLHQPDGSFTEAAKAILAGDPLDLDP